MNPEHLEHPDWIEARKTLSYAHYKLTTARRWHQHNAKGKDRYAVQYAEWAYCRALDCLWRVQDRLGINNETWVSTHD